MPIIIVIVILIFLASIIYLKIRISKLKAKIQRERNRARDYENIYYEAPHYEMDFPKTNSYLQLEEAIMNEYMSIKKVIFFNL